MFIKETCSRFHLQCHVVRENKEVDSKSLSLHRVLACACIIMVRFHVTQISCACIASENQALPVQNWYFFITQGPDELTCSFSMGKVLAFVPLISSILKFGQFSFKYNTHTQKAIISQKEKKITSSPSTYHHLNQH